MAGDTKRWRALEHSTDVAAFTVDPGMGPLERKTCGEVIEGTVGRACRTGMQGKRDTDQHHKYHQQVSEILLRAYQLCYQVAEIHTFVLLLNCHIAEILGVVATFAIPSEAPVVCVVAFVAAVASSL